MPIKFSLVVPTYNEAENLLKLYEKIIPCLDSLPFDSEIIVVDDNSPDRTWKVAEDLAGQDKRIKVIRRIKQRGLASAVVSGWAVAQGEILGVIDADLQHSPEVLAEMITRIITNQEADIIVASRYVRVGGFLNLSFGQIFRSRLANFLAGILIPKVYKLVKDPLSGYFIMRKKVIANVELRPIGYKILLEVLVKCRYKDVIEVPYLFLKREKGSSKASWKQYLVSLIHFLKLR